MTHKVSLKFNPWCFWPPYGLKYHANDSIFSDRLHLLNCNIPAYQHGTMTLLRTSPLHIVCIQTLAGALNQHYYILEQVDDLEQSILYYTEAIFLLPNWGSHFLNIVQNFFSIIQLLLLWAACTVHPEDVKCSIVYLRYLHQENP